MIDDDARTLRLLTVGASTTPVCGVRDYANVVDDALRKSRVEVEPVWWERGQTWSLSRTRSEQLAWLDRVTARVQEFRPDWIVWHYSVFAWSTRGLPHLVPPAARRLAGLHPPILLVAHELAFPFGRRAWTGLAWATSQRLALMSSVRASSAVVVTTEERLRWLESRRWLPTRPARFVPVCSNLPLVRSAANGRDDLVAGVFGFGTDGARAEETMQAIARLRGDGVPVRPLLVGAPGETGVAARWRAAAAKAGIADSIAFTGVLPLDGLARALAGCDVVIVPDAGGPSARKGTIAAGLALGRPVVATDGPHRWQRLVDERAVVLSAPSAEALARSLQPLLTDPEKRRAQADRASDFYRGWMAPEVVSRQLRAVIAETKTVAVRG